MESPSSFSSRHVAVFGAAQQFAHAAVEIAQFAFVQGIIQAQHGGAVLDFDEPLARLAAHAFGGRIGRRQLRVPRFQVPELAHERVVFGVGDLGLVEHIVQTLVAAELVAELFDFARGIFHGLLIYNLTRNPENTP